jgi:hypothetical protein
MMYDYENPEHEYFPDERYELPEDEYETLVLDRLTEEQAGQARSELNDDL